MDGLLCDRLIRCALRQAQGERKVVNCRLLVINKNTLKIIDPDSDKE
jgi:hypothetical protein